MTLAIATTERQAAIDDALIANVDRLARSQHDGRRIAPTRACDVKVERPVFLHNPLVPAKVLTLIAGRAGVSKSTLSIDIAAKATLGKLTGDWNGRPATVAFAAIEDDAGMQKARLQAAGADMTRVLFITVDDTRNGNTVSTGLQLPDDTATLRDTLREHDVKLLIIDPITSCIDGNTDKRDDVRRSLDPLAAIAQELQIVDAFTIDILTEDQQALNAFHCLSTGGDAHVDQTLRVVLRSDFQDTITRFANVSGQQCDVCDQFSSLIAEDVLLGVVCIQPGEAVPVVVTAGQGFFFFIKMI